MGIQIMKAKATSDLYDSDDKELLIPMGTIMEVDTQYPDGGIIAVIDGKHYMLESDEYTLIPKLQRRQS